MHVHRRRARFADFALRWDAALALAHAALAARPPSSAAPSSGEPQLWRIRGGRRQLRRAKAGLIEHAARQRFLAALSATANVALSAAAAGHACSFYRMRDRDPAFAREWQLALEMGYERLKMALHESAQVESFADDDWRRNAPPDMPPMTVNQALQLMYLHQKEARLGRTPDPMRQRRGETPEVVSKRLALLYEAGQERRRMQFKIAEAERLARGVPTHFDWAPGELPDLSQVTGWSRASGKPATDAGRALFGGWRLGDIPKQRK